MRTLVLIGAKGGCGKTTACVNLAACLAQFGKRTLLVDLDPQNHLALALSVPEAQIARSMYQVLSPTLEAIPLEQTLWQITRNLELAPASPGMTILDGELAGLPDRFDRLAKALKPLENRYDFCIIDTPANLRHLVLNALRVASEVILTVETASLAVHSLERQWELLESHRLLCGNLFGIRILPTLYDPRIKLARDVLAELREHHGAHLSGSIIHFNARLREAAAVGQPITELDPASRGFKDFQQLARELVGPTVPMSLDALRTQSLLLPEGPRPFSRVSA